MKTMAEAAIGVFDSGLGGLTCVKELLALMPNENIIYFGDTARVPYGNRSQKTISRYASQAIDFLLSNNVKLLINACGTMSSSLDLAYTKSLPVSYIDCISPAVEAAVQATKSKRVGIVATSATVSSRSFERAISDTEQTIEIFSKACPLFVPLVEYGYISSKNRITRLVAEDYLLSFKNEGIDTLILGCTHYPIISEIISDVIGKDITLIDSGAEAAKQAAKQPLKGALGKSKEGKLKVYISDNPIGFLDVATRFLGFQPNDVEQIDIETLEESRNNS